MDIRLILLERLRAATGVTIEECSGLVGCSHFTYKKLRTGASSADDWDYGIERAVVLTRERTISATDLPPRVADDERFQGQLTFSIGTPLEEMQASGAWVPLSEAETVAEIREHWKGPFHFGAPDGIVVNVTKDQIRTRMAIVDEDVWPPPATEKPLVPDPNARIPYSKEIAGGKLDVKDVIQPTYDEINKKYGLSEKQGD